MYPRSITFVLYVAGFGGSGSQVDSARMNLASSFVNGFVNAAFGQDKLLTDDGNKWLYKNKDHGMRKHVAHTAYKGGGLLWLYWVLFNLTIIYLWAFLAVFSTFYLPLSSGMLSAAASLGMILLWDVDGGLTQIDKYLYSSEDYIKV